MSVDDALLCSLRRDERARWNSTCTIVRETGRTFSTTTGTYSSTTTSIYSGACLILPSPVDERMVDFGQHEENTRRYDVQIAANTDVLPDDTLTVTDGGRDSDLTGAVMTVVDVLYSSYQVSRQLVCLHNQGA